PSRPCRHEGRPSSAPPRAVARVRRLDAPARSVRNLQGLAADDTAFLHAQAIAWAVEGEPQQLGMTRVATHVERDQPAHPTLSPGVSGLLEILAVELRLQHAVDVALEIRGARTLE